MVVEELVAKLGLKFSGSSEARKFVSNLERIKKAMDGLKKCGKIDFRGSTLGLFKTTRDFERAANAARHYRTEAERAAKVRPGRGGPGGGAFGPIPGRAPHPGKHPGGGIGEAALAGSGMGLGRAGAAAATAYGVGAIAKRALTSSMDFERAMIEVQKATDATDSERAEYAKQITRLARDTGKDKEGLAGMLAQAGFSGRPKDELMRFTAFGARASTAWGTTPEATGDAMAQIGNIYQADQTEIERIGNQINTMADKSASKEVDLLEILRRVGNTGKTAGMTSGDILGFGAGLKERGVQTEIAAGGIEDYINFLKLGEEYSKNADDGIKALGYTSDKLRKSFVAAPTKTALEFLDKIAAIKNPMKRAEVLTGIFGKTRQDDVERLASSVDSIRKNIELMGDPANYKGSVMEQFGKQLENDVAKIDQAKQQIDVLLQRVGDPIKQGLGAGAGKLNKALDYIDEREGNKAAKPSNVSDDLPGLDHLRHGPTSADFNERWNAAPAQYPRMTMIPNVGTGIPSITMQRGVGKRKVPTLGYGNAGSGAAPTFSPSNFGIGGAQGADMMRQSAQPTIQQVTHTTTNTNVGNDQRTQSVSVSVTASGLEAVGAAVLAKVQSGLSSLGPSIAKGNTTPTAPTLTGP